MKIILWVVVALAIETRASLFSSPAEEFSKVYNWEPSVDHSGKEVREAIFTQWVDHFDHADGATFDQTVFMNDQYYYPGGPVLIFVSATWDAYAFWLENSHMANIADQLGGVIYALEPRYIGTSFPTPDLAQDNLERYLQIDQMMGDYVDFITFLRQELIAFGSDKFVLIGYGRGGTLATWLHQSFPDLADGLWAVSAPTFTFFDFHLYYYGINTTFNQYYPETCQITIFEAFDELEGLLETNNVQRVKEVFNLDPNYPFNLTSRYDVGLFYYYLFDAMFAIVEYGTPYTIDLICNRLEPSNQFSSLELLGNLYGGALQDLIFDYDTFVEVLKQESLDAQPRIGLYGRQTLYTACTGWALFKVSSLLPYPINERFPSYLFGDLCNDVFGITYEQAVQNNNLTNVERKISPTLTNAYFTNAQFDPHHLIGVLEDLNPTATQDLVPSIGKLFDFSRIVFPDYHTEELEAVRNRAAQLIALWTT